MFLSKTGINAGNQASGGHYGSNPITRNRMQVEWCYRGSWIFGNAVDVLRWGRLHGGAVGIMMIEGQDPSTPLKKDSAGLRASSRWTAGLCSPR
jgi:hypothetical protein